MSYGHLLLEHGAPKSARFFDAGHMGYTADTQSVILDWIGERLQPTHHKEVTTNV